ncbi:MAG: hypothetical protein GWP16_03640, partial [Nitrospirae bacterium]|nr:hypothetical protein [Nitrospirota bacterium]
DVGLTAGASAPEHLVQEVIQFLRARGFESEQVVSRHRPTLPPITGWVDTALFHPQLECFGNDNGPRAVRRRCDIDQRDKFGGK